MTVTIARDIDSKLAQASNAASGTARRRASHRNLVAYASTNARTVGPSRPGQRKREAAATQVRASTLSPCRGRDSYVGKTNLGK